MNRLNFCEVYGYYLLAQEGLVVYNPKYVRRVGVFSLSLLNLRHKNPKNKAYLERSYTESIESAKFFATYPKDLTGKSVRELRALRLASKNNPSASV